MMAGMHEVVDLTMSDEDNAAGSDDLEYDSNEDEYEYNEENDEKEVAEGDMEEEDNDRKIETAEPDDAGMDEEDDDADDLPDPPGSLPLLSQDGSVSIAEISDEDRGLDVCRKDLEELIQIATGVQGGIWHCANSVVLTIAMDTSRFRLDEERATAWGLDPSMPVVFQIEMDTNYTNSVHPSKVLIPPGSFQTSEEIGKTSRHYQQQVGHGLAWALQDRLQTFLREGWPSRLLRAVDPLEKRRAADVAELAECCSAAPALAAFVYRQKNDNRMDAMNALLDQREKYEKLFRQQSGGSIPPPPVAFDDALAQLLGAYADMPIEDAISFLQRCHGNVQAALKLIEESHLANLQSSAESKGEQKEDGNVMSSVPVISNNESSEIFSKADRQRELERPFSALNYLLQLVHFVEDKMRTVNLRCLICDADVPYKGLTPVVCPGALCVHGYEQYSLGVDLGAKIDKHPEVTDVLISMLWAAVHGGRVELMFPEAVQVGDDSFKKADGTNDINKLRQTLSVIPEVQKLQEWSKAGILREELDKLNSLAYPLLRWIMASNRSHIRILKPEEKIPGLECQAQFLLMTGPLEQEIKFQSLKQETAKTPNNFNSFGRTGSMYAFHGSSIGNWHSIMRIGLKNMSQTKYMSAGAAYGNGIYFADDIGTSLGYSGSSSAGWPKSMYTPNVTFMALCEIIDRPDEFTHCGPVRGNRQSNKNSRGVNGIYVIPKEEYVSTRYLLVSPARAGCTASNLHIPKTVQGGWKGDGKAESGGQRKRGR